MRRGRLRASADGALDVGSSRRLSSAGDVSAPQLMQNDASVVTTPCVGASSPGARQILCRRRSAQSSHSNAAASHRPLAAGGQRPISTVTELLRAHSACASRAQGEVAKLSARAPKLGKGVRSAKLADAVGETEAALHAFRLARAAARLAAASSSARAALRPATPLAPAQVLAVSALIAEKNAPRLVRRRTRAARCTCSLAKTGSRLPYSLRRALRGGRRLRDLDGGDGGHAASDASIISHRCFCSTSADAASSFTSASTSRFSPALIVAARRAAFVRATAAAAAAVPPPRLRGLLRRLHLGDDARQRGARRARSASAASGAPRP